MRRCYVQVLLVSIHLDVTCSFVDQNWFGKKARSRLKLFRVRGGPNDEEMELGPGMLDAFRQLDSLQSLGDEDDTLKQDVQQAPKPISGEIPPETKSLSQTPLEKEVQMYAKMIKDLEVTDENKLISDVISDMGGDSSGKFETSKQQKGGMSTQPTQQDMEVFLDSALKEALNEVKLKAPDSLSTESILNDKEIMKEIEAIFDRGSEQLMKSLEEIRAEQISYAKVTAENSAQEAVDTLSQESNRLARAEASMTAMLDRVNKEAAQVEKAVEELRDARKEMDKDFLLKLRNGGIPKQAALVGFLLFSVRSIVDTVAALNDDTLLAGALLQGAIALACAAIFFFV